MKPWMALLTCTLLWACAPTATQQEEEPIAEITPLDSSTARALQGAFQDVFLDAGIVVQNAQAFKYTGLSASGFTGLINLFYKKYPGFCPVVNGFVIAEERPNTFMTLTARGKDVRAFVYDQSEKPFVTYAYLEGESRGVLDVRPCDNDLSP